VTPPSTLLTRNFFEEVMGPESYGEYLEEDMEEERE
jgi:hypothetical protein